MIVGDERDKLAKELKQLREELGDVTIHNLKTEDEIENWISRITTARVKIKQFKSRFGENDWKNWGYSIWNNIEHSLILLERKLEFLEKDSAKSLRAFDRKVTTWSLFF